MFRLLNIIKLFIIECIHEFHTIHTLKPIISFNSTARLVFVKEMDYVCFAEKSELLYYLHEFRAFKE